MGRLTSNQEYSRSISVPGDRTGTMARSERGSHFPRMASSPEEKSVDLFPVCESSIRNNISFTLLNSGYYYMTKTSPVNTSGPSPALSPVTTPAQLCFTTNTAMSIDEDSLVICGRRSASNSQPATAGTSGYMSPFPLSPEVDGGKGGALGEGAIETEDGFYLLKKDSQRRQTLTRVLSQDGKKICDVWLRSLQREVGQTPLTAPNLMTLMRGLRDFIPELNKLAIENAITTLRDEVDFDVLALNHIQLALYLFQEAVS